MPVGAQVLDWGAGNGHFSYFLQRGGDRATAFSLLPFEFESGLPVERLLRTRMCVRIRPR